MKKRIAILGSTGSIGRQALEVLSAHSDRFELEVITAQQNAGLLIKQAIEFKPNFVVIGNEDLYSEVSDALFLHDIKVFAGEESISQIIDMDSVDIVLIALVGFAGLKPTIRAIEAGKRIALANKESLVVAGDLITKLAVEKRVSLIPVDSEHSAIFQCLSGENPDTIEKIYLTASGGPFRGKSWEEIQNATVAQALKHPNWNMGDKITIDSASMMNKGLEVMEAKWLFGLDPDQIDVITHPQSIVHSIVQFQDSSMKAQMGLPDMRLPIQYAFGFPDRLKSDFPRFDFLNYPQLTFEKPDIKIFRNLALAFEALERGGNMPCILNAANEIAVDAFLKNKIGFTRMPEIIEKSMERVDFVDKPTLDDYFLTDEATRIVAMEIINDNK